MEAFTDGHICDESNFNFLATLEYQIRVHVQHQIRVQVVHFEILNKNTVSNNNTGIQIMKFSEIMNSQFA